ncbi:hypothetical protein [uncultured Tateyamaria sp.]|uniref:hypothetical protein n=1 Tax=uncultured Tateyamaria sp. TaxID=455651 RepID=UPI002602779C|nr:hypothetical protein [uncultured Tateyamaria sp.]
MNQLCRILSAPFRRGPRRPLAARRPDRQTMGQEHAVPLGMEATDLALVDRVNRKNDALERVTLPRNGQDRTLSGLSGASTLIDPMPEDETYAARYHRAYNKKED